MLVVNRQAGTFEDKRFADFPGYIEAGDCVVFNNTRVLPARLFGRRARTGGAIEALLLRPVDGPGYWEALVRPGRKMRIGDRVIFDEEPINDTGKLPTSVFLVGEREGVWRIGLVNRAVDDDDDD